jgi:hypothetical protein
LMLKKSLDIPWINTVVYIAAMFTSLFISSMRKDQLSPVDMDKLKTDMTTWVNVLGECDHFLSKSYPRFSSLIPGLVVCRLQMMKSC